MDKELLGRAAKIGAILGVILFILGFLVETTNRLGFAFLMGISTFGSATWLAYIVIPNLDREKERKNKP